MALQHAWEVSKVEGKIEVIILMEGSVYQIQTDPVLTNGSIDTEKTNESAAALAAEVESLGKIPDRFEGEGPE